MKALFRVATLPALVMLFFSGIGSAAPSSPLEGVWMGTLSAQGLSLRIVFHFAQTADGQWQGTLDSLDQPGATGIPISEITLDSKALHCGVASIYGTFDGSLADDGQSIPGTWAQAGQRLPLTLKRATPEATAPPKRPQEPTPPYPYSQEDVVFSNPAANIELAGTLTKPKGPGPFPAVLLIAGSGPQNRNEEVAGHKIFLVLADDLTRRGIAVLRVDKRGIGLSKGDYAHATTDDFVSDALSAVTYLRSRPDINARRIGLIGHSEGAIVAPAAAVRSRHVAFAVLIGAPAVRGDQVLLRQGELIRAADSHESAAATALGSELSKQLIEAVEQEADDTRALQRMHEIWTARKAMLMTSGLTDAEQRQIEATGPALEALMKRLTTPWMRHFLTYDPAPVLHKLRQPILVLYGSLDLQVPPEQNKPVMEKALQTGMSKDHTVTEVQGINHVMQRAETGSPSEYQRIETTIDPQMLQLIGHWISTHANLTNTR
jgi:pimeloyl-ACP methyl ester carboxylesterase